MQAGGPPPAKVTVTLDFARYQIVELLKKHRRGLTLEDIEAKTKFKLQGNNALLNSLFANPYLVWDGWYRSIFTYPVLEEKGKLQYKVQHEFDDIEELLDCVSGMGEVVSLTQKKMGFW
jgi:hypothetical protein